MKILLDSVKQYWIEIITGALLSTASGIFAVNVIRIINQYIQNKNAEFDLPSFITIFLGYLAGFSICSIISTKLLSRVSNQIAYDLRVNLTAKVLNANYHEIEFRKDKLMVVLMQDILTIARTTDQIPGMLSRAILATGGIIYMIILSWKLSSLILGMLVLVYLLIIQTNKSLKVYSEKARKTYDIIYERFQDLIYGLKELKLSDKHQSDFLNRNMAEACKDHQLQKINERVNVEVTGRISETFLLIGVGVIIILMNTMDFISQGIFIEFLTVTLFISSPLSTLAHFSKNLSPFYAAVNEIKATGLYLDNEYHSNGSSSLDFEKDLILKEVSYKYFNEEIDNYFILGPLDLQIQKAKITMIVGGNGSGKTTLAKLLAGLYLPKTGSISLGPELINEAKLKEYRNGVAAIFTDNYLFKDMGHIQKWDQQKAIKYLELFDLNHKVSISNQRFSSSRLSSGQKKRLALIGGLMENKNLYIFDEWAANQDPKFKKIFYAQILPELKKNGKTLLVISHDDQYFEYADYVVKLVEGKIKKASNPD